MDSMTLSWNSHKFKIPRFSLSEILFFCRIFKVKLSFTYKDINNEITIGVQDKHFWRVLDEWFFVFGKNVNLIMLEGCQVEGLILFIKADLIIVFRKENWFIDEYYTNDVAH